MKSQNKKGFTLIELIIVIAIIVILAAIVVITINPATLFANSRNSARANDMGTIQTAIARYLADTPTTATIPRSLGDLTGYNTVTIGLVTGGAAAGAYTGITSTAAVYAPSPANTLANCPGGAKGTFPSFASLGAWKLTAGTSGAGLINVQTLLDNGYLTKLPADPINPVAQPSYQNYSACIDTLVPTGSSSANPGKLVIFAPNTEPINSVTTVPYVVI